MVERGLLKDDLHLINIFPVLFAEADPYFQPGLFLRYGFARKHLANQIVDIVKIFFHGLHPVFHKNYKQWQIIFQLMTHDF